MSIRSRGEEEPEARTKPCIMCINTFMNSMGWLDSAITEEAEAELPQGLLECLMGMLAAKLCSCWMDNGHAAGELPRKTASYKSW